LQKFVILTNARFLKIKIGCNGIISKPITLKNHCVAPKNISVICFCFKFASMKKLLLFLLVVILLSACNKAVCPAYNDSVNNLANTLTQKGNYRANGINRVYRDSPQKRHR